VTAVFDARELFRALVEHGVDFVTVGGVAIQAHGGQRMTRDLDVAVASSRENFEALHGALLALDARILDRDGRHSSEVPGAALLASGEQWHLITAHGPLDVVTLPARLGPFDRFSSRAHRVRLGDLVVPVAAREDLLVLKRAAGRPRDLADIELLESLADGESPAPEE